MSVYTFIPNSAGASTGGATAASLNATYTSNNTAGNFLVSVYRLPAGSAHTFLVTDTRLNTWIKLLDFTNLTERYQLWYVLNCNAGANTVTITPNSATFLRMAIAEYSGVATSLATDGNQSNIGTGTAVSSGTVATSNGGYTFTGNDGSSVTWGAGVAAFKLASPAAVDILIGFTANQTADNVTFTNTSGFTTRQTVDGNLQLADAQTSNLVGYGTNDCGGVALPAQEPSSTTFLTNQLTFLFTPITGGTRGPINLGVLYESGGGGNTPGFGQIFPTGRE